MEFGLTATARKPTSQTLLIVRGAHLSSPFLLVATSELSKIKLSRITLPLQLVTVAYEITEDNSAISEDNVSRLVHALTKIIL